MREKKTTKYNHDSFIRNNAGIHLHSYRTVVSVVDLRSDTVTSPTRKMLEQALTARTGGVSVNLLDRISYTKPFEIVNT